MIAAISAAIAALRALNRAIERALNPVIAVLIALMLTMVVLTVTARLTALNAPWTEKIQLILLPTLAFAVAIGPLMQWSLRLWAPLARGYERSVAASAPRCTNEPARGAGGVRMDEVRDGPRGEEEA